VYPCYGKYLKIDYVDRSRRNRSAEESRADAGKTLGAVGREQTDLAATGGARQLPRRERSLGGARRGRRGIDHSPARPEPPRNGVREQGKMRAAEHDRIDAIVEVGEVPLGDRVDRRPFAPALFRQRDEDLA
jgi:hypothetical protein